MKPTEEQITRALKLAVKLLFPYEPPDSRAVSNEFVALAALSCGLVSDEDMAVIDRALAGKEGK